MLFDENHLSTQLLWLSSGRAKSVESTLSKEGDGPFLRSECDAGDAGEARGSTELGS
jgi:hypothetical protein